MKIQEVMLRAIAKKITWWQAAGNLGLSCRQIERTKWRSTLSGCRVTVYEHLDGRLSVGYGPHIVGRYDSEGKPVVVNKLKTRCKSKSQKELSKPDN